MEAIDSFSGQKMCCDKTKKKIANNKEFSGWKCFEKSSSSVGLS